MNRVTIKLEALLCEQLFLKLFCCCHGFVGRSTGAGKDNHTLNVAICKLSDIYEAKAQVDLHWPKEFPDASTNGQTDCMPQRNFLIFRAKQRRNWNGNLSARADSLIWRCLPAGVLRPD